MGIEIIPDQPVNLDPYVEDECNVGDGKKYCTLYNVTDNVYLQWKITSCGDDLSCDPTFTGGTNLVTNPDFTDGVHGWSLDASAAWDSVNKNLAFVLSSNSKRAWFYFPLGTTIPGATYLVTFTVSGRTAGTILVNVSGGTNGTPRGTNSTFTENITAGSDLSYIRFTATSTFDGSIDDVVITLDATGCVTVGTNWSYNPGGLVHTPGDTMDSNINTTFVENTGYQQIVVTLSNVRGGSLYISLYGDPGNLLTMLDGTTAMTQDGTYYFYTEEVGGGILAYLFPSLDFDGTVSELHVHELHRDYSVVFTDLDGGFVYDATSDITYYGDRAIVKTSAGNLGEGCFYANLVDPCEDLLSGGSQELVNAGDFSTPAAWTLSGGGATITITGGKLKMTTVSTPANNVIFAAQYYSSPPLTGVYVCKTTLITGAMDSGALPLAKIQIGASEIPGTMTETIRVYNPTANTTYVSYKIVTLDPIGEPGVGIIMSFIDDSTAGHINEIDSLSIEYTPVDTVTSIYGYTSNCLAVKAAHDCAKLVEGYKDSIGNAMGFYFPDSDGTAFRLSQRNRVIKFNPYYPIESDDQRFTDGARKYNYAEREKYYDAKFDYMDETGHDALSAEIVMDIFEIDGVQYFVKPEDYKPQWSKDEGQNLAQVRLDIRKVTGTKYKNR